jgi:hypothetical protein
MTEFSDIIGGMLSGYARAEKLQDETIAAELNAAFGIQGGLIDKVKAMDEVFDNHPKFDQLRELCFDMLMIRFLSTDSRKLEDTYLESPEWQKIEERTIDRGTEALNIFLYLAEAKDTEVVPSLDDFLNEFLLVEDDLYQDEYDIYEPIIKNEDLVEGTAEEIVEAESKIKDGEMKEIFLPLMLFFNKELTDLEKDNAIQAHSKTPGVHLALLQAIRGFAKK